MLRRLASVLGLTVTLAGLPVVLRAAAGPPSLAGLPTWQWLRDGLRDQYLPVDPILQVLGLLAWSLWGYAVIVAILRVLAVLAARRRLVGAAALLALSNLVTLASVRGLLDASIGVSLLAASTRAPPTSTTAAAAPVAVVRTFQPQAAHDAAGWDRARPLLDDTRAPTVTDQPPLVQPDPPMLSRAASPVAARPEPAAPVRPAAGTRSRTYTVEDGDSLWRIAEQQLGDGLRWREIWALNHGRDMGGGRVFRHAGLILPGWVLHLPTHEQPASAAPPSQSESHERHDSSASTTAPAPATSAPAPSTTINAPPPPAGRAAGDPGQRGSPATRPAPAAQPGRAPQRGHGDEDGHSILELPTGEVVGITLAAAITAALAVARLRQRRRRLPTWPPDQDSAAPLEAGPTTKRLVRFAHRYTKPPDDEPAEAAVGAATPPALPPHGPVDPRDPAPARVVVAERAGEELAVDLAGFGAITITGPRTADAARAAMVAVLAAGRPTDTQVLLAGGRLLPQAPELPGLRRAATLAEALALLEAELVGRARMLELYEQPDFASYRTACPDDPLPALLLVADEPPAGQAGRLGAVAEQGRRLGVGVLLAGVEAERAARIGLDERGRVQVVWPAPLGDGQLVGARMLTLDAAQATDLLSTLAAARTDQQPAPAGQQPPAEQHTIRQDLDHAPPRDQPARHRPTEQAPAPPAQEASSRGDGAEPTGTADVPATEPAPTATPDGDRPEARPLLTVRLLGAYQIQAGDSTLGAGLRVSARELLAYVVAHPGGVTIEQAVEALWPDTALGKERQQFWNALGNLRSVLRQASGHPGKAIVHEHGRYLPEEGLFAVDLWRFQQAIDQAREATDDETAVTAALRVAADAYGGSLLDGEPYGWVEPARQALRDQAVDALSRLAELRDQAGDDHGAQAALERAVQADPVAEECYRRLMRLHARQRRLDLAQRRYRQLKDRLEELGADPDPETTRLLADLRRQYQAGGARP